MEARTHARIKNMSVQFLATDLSRAIHFYTEKLGFQVDFLYDDFYAGVSKDGFSIHLKDGMPSSEERQKKRSNKDLDIVFSVEEIEALYEELTGNSVEIIQPLRTMDYGKEFYIADPDSYIIGFVAAT